MAEQPGMAALAEARGLVEALGPKIMYRKMHGIMNALEMQLEDEHFSQGAVRALGNALLETAELYEVDARAAQELGTVLYRLVKELQEG